MHTIGDRLEGWRKDQRLTQPEAATRLGMPMRTYQNYENNVRPPNTKAWKAFVDAGISANWLLTGKGPMLREDQPPAAEEGFAYPDTPLIRELSAEEPGCAAIPTSMLTDDQYDAWAGKVSTEGFLPVRYYNQVAMSAGHGALNEDHEPGALLFSRRFLRSIGAHPKQLLLVRVRGDSMYPTLHDGWTVMIDVARRRVDSGIYAIQSGGQEMVKRLESRVGGAVRVISDNRHYEEYEANTGDDGFAVIGKVVWIAGRAQ